MTIDQLFWTAARIAALSAYASLSIAVLTGIALRTGLLDWLGSNRALRELHEFTTYLWIPFGVFHVVALLFDTTARIGLADVVVPFRAAYGTLAIGIGTLSLDIVVVVTVAALFKGRMNAAAWRWLHRLSYVAFALIFLHAVLGGTDMGDPIVSAITWASAVALLVLASTRVIWGRLPA
jgi:methionine sulfoxide reductase heme-binding subunit